MNCKICNSLNISIVYNGFLRTGSFGKITDKKYNVYNCQNCKSKFIDDILAKNYYETPEYRLNYNDTTDPSKFYEEYDQNDTNKIAKIGLNNLRDRVVADFGTAAGTFLQSINNITKYTVAVEPTQYFHEILKNYCKHTFSYGKDLVDNKIKIDVATSFDVIEHVGSPVEFLREIHNSLQDDGKLYLKTPNFHDVLHELIPEVYDQFNYRTAHLFYFDKDSISYILKEAGFENFKVEYMHDYDMSNLLYWMKEARPTGLHKTKIFDSGFNLIYKYYLEQTGKASHLWIEAQK